MDLGLVEADAGGQVLLGEAAGFAEAGEASVVVRASFACGEAPGAQLPFASEGRAHGS